MSGFALPQGKKIVIGLGSGRSGTASLTSLLDRQTGGVCFHEMNPAGSVFSGNPQPSMNTLREFTALLAGGPRHRLAIDYSRPASLVTYERLQSMPELNVIGDIAFYYLNYVEDILTISPEAKFVCIQRDKAQTIASWVKKSTIGRWPSIWLADKFKSLVTRTPFYESYNYWQEHEGTRWQKDPVWDSCFPKFEAPSKEEAIGMYWDAYYRQAAQLQAQFTESFRIFSLEELNTVQGQKDILAFIGLPENQWVLADDVHLHKSPK